MIDYKKVVSQIQASDNLKNRIHNNIRKAEVPVKPRKYAFRRSLVTICCTLLLILVCSLLYRPIMDIGLQNPPDSKPPNSVASSSPPSTSNSGLPAAEYKREKISFDQAKNVTRWPLKQAAPTGFLGYVLITIPTQDSPDVEYDYTFGSVRFSPVLFEQRDYSDYLIVDYQSHRFYVDNSSTSHYIVYSSPSYTVFADIDETQKSRNESLDLILSLIF